MISDKNRFIILDRIRGIIIINMVLYHLLWDMVYLYHIPMDWYKGVVGNIWQKMICMGFIFLSGFCANFGKRTLARGVKIFAVGGAFTLFTAFFMPEQIIIFGILTFLGSAMIIIALFKKHLKRLNSYIGVILSLSLFLIFYDVNNGCIAFGTLPERLYKLGYAGAFLGFTPENFVSYDYFSLIPWLFLFWAGFYACGIVGNKLKAGNKRDFLSLVGRNSLLIYVLHQPVIYGVLYMLHKK